MSKRKDLKATKVPSELLVFTNKVYCNPSEFSNSTNYVLINDTYCFFLEENDKILPGEIGTSLYQRNWAGMYEGERASVTMYDPKPEEILASLDFKIDFVLKSIQLDKPCEIDYDKFCAFFQREFSNTVFTVGQPIPILYNSAKFLLSVTAIESANLGGTSVTKQIVGSYQTEAQRGIFTAHSVIHISSGSPNFIHIKGNIAAQPSVLLQPNFKFEDMGIGGLDEEFKSVFRRAFVSRIFPPNIVEQMGISHVRGVILYGPPGTGKTLMARQIGKMLGSHEPKKISGPEILNKYVGQSEENVRNLFKDAELEYKERGNDSQLHIIIFDEIDAICRQRGSRADSTGVTDTVVNQLLSKMDGVDQLNNILVIGMTNRIDLIDEALKRPGRFEVIIEISLPDEAGRLQILRIHTEKMRKNNILDSSVDLPLLAERTKNFSGAEIEGLIKSASSFSLNRHVKVGTIASVSNSVEHLKVLMQDFDNALEEVHAAFGRSESEFENCALYGLIPFNSTLKESFHIGTLMANQLQSLESKSRVLTLLLYGESGTGKTALASEIAKNANFPFMKMITPESVVALSELGKVAYINKVFEDAHRSPLGVVVIDCIEKLMEFVALGPRFSNLIYQCLSVLIKKIPPKGRNLLVIITTSNKTLLDEMDLTNACDKEIYVPPVRTTEELSIILHELGVFTRSEIEKITYSLASNNFNLNIGVKKLINLVEMSGQELAEDRVDVFTELLLSAHLK